MVDNVAGDGCGHLITQLKCGGRYASSGAIGGPLVSFDVRDVYLKDVALLCWTAWDEPVFPNLIGYIEKRSDQATGGQVLALKDNAQAQQEFMERRHIGNFVLLPLGG